MSSVTNARVIKKLTFKDGSVYRGQIVGNGTDTPLLPYGYGTLTTDTNFTVTGYFIDGKNSGTGVFTAANGDRWYGVWNDRHRRHGGSIFVRAADTAVIAETYSDGVREKHVRKLPCKVGSLHWSTLREPVGTSAGGGDGGPCSRSGHTCINIDNKCLIVYGGVHDGLDMMADNATAVDTIHCMNDLWQYDIAAQQWTQLCTNTTLPYLTGHTCTRVGNALLFIGGLVNNDAVVMNSDVYKYDLVARTWSTLVSKAVPFANHCTVYCERVNRLFVLVNSTIFELDLHTLKYEELRSDYTAIQRARLPIGLMNATATYVSQLKQIWVIGGKIIDTAAQNDAAATGKVFDKCNSHVRVLDVDTLTWSLPQISQPPTAVSDKPAKPVKGDYSGVSSMCSGGSQLGRAEHTAALMDDRFLYVYAGVSTVNPQYNIVDTCHLSDVQILDTVEQRWLTSKTETMIQPLPRSMHTSVIVGNELYVYGGRNYANESIPGWSMLYTHASTHTDAAVPAAAKVKPLHAEKAVVKPAAVQPAGVQARRKVVLPDRSAAVADTVTESKQQHDVADESEYVEPVIDHSQPTVGSGSILDMFKANMNM